MKTSHDIMRERLLIEAKVIEPEPLIKRTAPTTLPSLEEIREMQRSRRFEKLCQNRMVMGYFRYGCLETQRKQGGNGYDNVGSAIDRLNLYRDTGNDEHLVDVSNLCLVEFEVGSHPKKHFNSVDDGVHVRK